MCIIIQSYSYNKSHNIVVKLDTEQDDILHLDKESHLFQPAKRELPVVLHTSILYNIIIEHIHNNNTSVFIY